MVASEYPTVYVHGKKKIVQSRENRVSAYANATYFAENCATSILSMLNFLIMKLTMSAVAERPVTITKTESNPLMYEERMALFCEESAISRKTKMYCSES